MLSVGSRIPELQELVADIFQLCIQHNIPLVPEWVPREENSFADEIYSTSIDVDDYILSPDIFPALNILWEPHTTDHFSSFKIRQIPHFSAVGGTQGQK